MSKRFFGSFEHGKFGGFVINEDLYITVPDSSNYKEDNTLVYVGLRHEYPRRFCDVPNIETGEEICKWILFELLPMYNEWKQSRYTRTPWEMKEKAEMCLDIFKKKSRMYKYEIMGKEHLCLSKIWNRGMGLLETIRMFPDTKTVLVNSALWTKRDERVLQSVLKELGMEDWGREVRFYGYPIYYNNPFDLQLKG